MSKQEEHLDRLRRTNLVDYCTRVLGWTAVHEGHDISFREHDSLKINRDSPWEWCWHSRGRAGKAIDFIMEYKGVSFKDAKMELERYNGIDYKHESKKPENKPSVASQKPVNDLAGVEWYRQVKGNRAIGWLTGLRGLDFKVIIPYFSKGLIRQGKEDKVWNCYFLIRDFEDNIVGAEVRGIGYRIGSDGQPYQPESMKYKGTRGGGGYGFSLQFGDSVTRLGFFESAVDLLSFVQLFPDDLADSLLVSGGGSRVIDVALRYMEHYPEAAAVCFCDDDSSGAADARAIGIDHIPPTKPYNDWNEQLLGGFHPIGNTELPFDT